MNLQEQKAGKELWVKHRLIVALDKPDKNQVIHLIQALGDEVLWYKVGMELYYNQGNALVEEILAAKKKVFLDLKFHDIPNTVEQASRAATRLGISMFNVHAAGGMQMMRQAKEGSLDEAAKNGLKPPMVLGMTILTSLSQDVFNHEVGFTGTIRHKVLQWAEMAGKAGLDGVVASAQEAEAIKRECGPDFKVITPGIRPAGSTLDDQSRVMDPATALAAGSDYLVVGRPITRDVNPVNAAILIKEQMAGAAKDQG